MLATTFALDQSTFAFFYLWIVTALIVLCIPGCTGKAMFHLLLQFFKQMLQDLHPTCLKFPLKARILSAADLDAIILTLINQKLCSTLIFQLELCKIH